MSGRRSIAVCTRLHYSNSMTAAVDVAKIVRFLDSAGRYADAVVVAFGGTDAQLAELQACVDGWVGGERPAVTVLPVRPWGQFVGPLNALLGWVVQGSWDLACFQSLEVRIDDPAAVLALAGAVEPDTLVAGAALCGHAFAVGTHAVNGRTVPWNTLAVWDARKLGLLGFPLVADGRPGEGGFEGGVEEVAAVCSLQRLRPSDTRVKLLRIASLATSWDVLFADPERAAWHDRKMVSKVTRPQAQLEAMGIFAGDVTHIDLAC